MTFEEKVLAMLEKQSVAIEKHNVLIEKVLIDVGGLQQGQAKLEQDVVGIKQDVVGIKQDVADLTTLTRGIIIHQNEDYELLKSVAKTVEGLANTSQAHENEIQKLRAL